MKLRIKRWTYRLNGHQVVVECAFSLWGWSQERLIVDAEERARSGGWWRIGVELNAEVHDQIPPTQLRAALTPGFLTVHCLLWAHGALVPSRSRVTRSVVRTRRGRWPETAAA